MLRRITRFALPLCWASLFLGLACRAQAPDRQDAPAAPAPEAAGLTDQISAVPNRPTFSTTAESVQAGVFEIEYGFELAYGHQNINGLLKFGATKNLELRFANNPIERDSGVAGTGDSGAGFKYRIIQQKGSRPTFAALYTATIPTATAGGGAGAIGVPPGGRGCQTIAPHTVRFH